MKQKKENKLDNLLNDESYHIEFNGHLTNHAKHAVVALRGLGASNEKIKTYYDNYAALTPYGYPLEPKRSSRYTITKENWQQYIGKRTSFSAYYEFFNREEKKLGMYALLQQYIPILLSGWVGSLSHATIHLGFALDVQNRCMILEGLAYMAFSSVSCHPEKIFSDTKNLANNKTVFDSLLDIANTLETEFLTFQTWVEEMMCDNQDVISQRIHPELMRSGLQYRIAKMLATGHPLIYRKPIWIDDDSVSSVLNQLYYLVTLFYVEKPGDFLLLHLITALFAMEKIIEHIPTETQKYALNCFWIGMLCILFSRGEFPKKATLQLLNAQYQDAMDVRDDVESEWKKIIADAMSEEEEHNPKMVYVLHRMWKLSNYRSIFRVAASYFTTTPILPKSFETPPVE